MNGFPAPESAPDGGPPLVGVVMGSDSDWPVMEAASKALEEFGVPHEVDVVSAHRMPRDMIEYGSTAHERGLRVIVAGADDRAAQLREALVAHAGRLHGEASAKGERLRARRAGAGLGFTVR